MAVNDTRGLSDWICGKAEAVRYFCQLSMGSIMVFVAHWFADSLILFSKQKARPEVFLGHIAIVHYNQPANTSQYKILDRLVRQGSKAKDEDRG